MSRADERREQGALVAQGVARRRVDRGHLERVAAESGRRRRLLEARPGSCDAPAAARLAHAIDAEEHALRELAAFLGCPLVRGGE